MISFRRTNDVNEKRNLRLRNSFTFFGENLLSQIFGPVAQRQSRRLITGRFLVRIQAGPQILGNFFPLRDERFRCNRNCWLDCQCASGTNRRHDAAISPHHLCTRRASPKQWRHRDRARRLCCYIAPPPCCRIGPSALRETPQ